MTEEEKDKLAGEVATKIVGTIDSKRWVETKNEIKAAYEGATAEVQMWEKKRDLWVEERKELQNQIDTQAQTVFAMMQKIAALEHPQWTIRSDAKSYAVVRYPDTADTLIDGLTFEKAEEMVRKLEAAVNVCEIYFNIAAEVVGEEEVRRRVNADIEKKLNKPAQTSEPWIGDFVDEVPPEPAQKSEPLSPEERESINEFYMTQGKPAQPWDGKPHDHVCAICGIVRPTAAAHASDASHGQFDAEVPGTKAYEEFKEGNPQYGDSN